MSHAEYASRPLPVFTKLAAMLRNFPAVQFVIAKVSALLRGGRASREPLISALVDAAAGTVDQYIAVLKRSSGHSIAAPEWDDLSEREKLIRRRWTETGIKMWNPSVHGAGLAALNIQGRPGLLPPKPGETLPRYDKLEFKMTAGQIVCEGVVVDPPKGRRKPGEDLLA